MPADRLKQQEEKTKVLEEKVKIHKRERVLIYDAAMKHVRAVYGRGVKMAERRRLIKLLASILTCVSTHRYVHKYTCSLGRLS